MQSLFPPQEFAKTKSPVKLKNVAVEDQTLIVKRQTQIVKLPVLNFHYDAKTTKTYTIADLLKDSPLDKTLVDIKLVSVIMFHFKYSLHFDSLPSTKTPQICFNTNYKVILSL